MKEEVARILVPLDAAADHRAAIDTAARLAARWQVPLHGVFVEDEELLGFADLPFAAQVTHAGRQRLTRIEVETHLRAFAERARRELHAAAERHRVRASYAVLRGPLAAALREGDFVVAGAVSRPVGGHFRLRSRWSAAAASARHPLFLARRDFAAGGSVVLLLARPGREAARLLRFAAEIAGIGGRALKVLGAGDVAPPALAEWVAEILEPGAVEHATEKAPPEPHALRLRAAELDCRLFVLAADGPEGLQQPLADLAAEAGCDLLLAGG